MARLPSHTEARFSSRTLGHPQFGLLAPALAGLIRPHKIQGAAAFSPHMKCQQRIGSITRMKLRRKRSFSLLAAAKELYDVSGNPLTQRTAPIPGFHGMLDHHPLRSSHPQPRSQALLTELWVAHSYDAGRQGHDAVSKARPEGAIMHLGNSVNTLRVCQADTRADLRQTRFWPEFKVCNNRQRI